MRKEEEETTSDEKKRWKKGIETEERRAGEREKIERIGDGGKTRKFKEREMESEKKRECLN